VRRFTNIGVWLLVSGVVAIGLYAGISLRFWVFDICDAIHFESDIQRQMMWGMECLGPEGFLNQYDKMANEPPDSRPFLDYSPLRLAVMTGWAACVKHRFPGIESVPAEEAYDFALPPSDRGSYEPTSLALSRKFQGPVLWFNVIMDLVGVVAAFEVTRFWVKKTSHVELEPTQRRSAKFTGVAVGLLAALVLWFNPNVLLDAYAWPTWDAWVISMYLLSAVLVSHERWFTAGISVAIGLMLKGQIATVIPVFILWPLVWRGFGASLRLMSGLTFGVALIVSPWMITYIPPSDSLQKIRALQELLPIDSWPPTLFAIRHVIDWPAVLYLAGITLTILLAGRLAKFRRGRIWLALIVFAIAVWPWLLPRNHGDILCGIVCSTVLCGVAVRFSTGRGERTLVAASALGIGLLLCMRIFHGSAGWWDCAFRFPRLQAPFLIWGPASNLPGIFEVRFGWPPPITTHAFTVPALLSAAWWHHWPAEALDVSIGSAFDSAYAFFLALASLGIGSLARQNDRRILVALVTPWLLFFLLPVRLHERYLLFAAGTAAICSGYSVGMMLLGWVLTIASTVMTLVQMGRGMTPFGLHLSRVFPSIFSPQSGDTIRSVVQGTHPDIGWGILVIGGVFFYFTIGNIACMFRGHKGSSQGGQILLVDKGT
jgi:hypothetical protein